MTPLCEPLETLEHARVCFLGLGNLDYGDDGFGVCLASELTKSGMPDVVIAGTAPEQCLGQIAEQKFDDVVFLDAVDFGAPPGSLVVMKAAQIRLKFPQISTHKISLAVLSELAQANGRTQVWLLGVQPESLRPGSTLTPTVQATLELVKDLLLEDDSGKSLLDPVLPWKYAEEHVC
jgi:hydrogenase maturation protease